MALTTVEKMALDNAIRANLENYINAGVMSKIDMLNTLQSNYSTTSIIASLNRVAKEFEKNDVLQGSYNASTQTFSFRRGKKLSYDMSVAKDKNILHLNCYEGLEYDFITKKFNMDMTSFVNYRDVFHFIKLEEVLQYEWIYNYVNDLDEVYDIVHYINDHSLCEKMPQGFIKVIQENNNTFTREMLENYALKMKYGKYFKFVREISSDTSVVDNFLNTFSCGIDTLYKLVTLDILNGEMYGGSTALNCIQSLTSAKDFYTIDLNRGLYHNRELAKVALNEHRNEILGSQLRKLNFINGMTFGENGEYTVVVPQSQEDKIEEGRMQNNCVGSYYDSSIIQGDNYIYFLRKTNNVKHSYITCRYNVHSRNTVEARYVNNRGVYDDKEIEILATISNIITNNLNK
jgi:hypothetical protein